MVRLFLQPWESMLMQTHFGVTTLIMIRMTEDDIKTLKL